MHCFEYVIFAWHRTLHAVKVYLVSMTHDKGEGLKEIGSI